jgi:spore maturation protein CgeB
MATYGFSPATRVFEAAGAGACIITDSWKGISQFFEPKQEILVANSTEEVKNHLLFLGENCATSIGKAAMKKALSFHTYGHRAQKLEEILQIKNNVT